MTVQFVDVSRLAAALATAGLWPSLGNLRYRAFGHWTAWSQGRGLLESTRRDEPSSPTRGPKRPSGEPTSLRSHCSWGITSSAFHLAKGGTVSISSEGERVQCVPRYSNNVCVLPYLRYLLGCCLSLSAPPCRPVPGTRQARRSSPLPSDKLGRAVGEWRGAILEREEGQLSADKIQIARLSVVSGARVQTTCKMKEEKVALSLVV